MHVFFLQETYFPEQSVVLYTNVEHHTKNQPSSSIFSVVNKWLKSTIARFIRFLAMLKKMKECMFFFEKNLLSGKICCIIDQYLTPHQKSAFQLNFFCGEQVVEIVR